MWRFGSGKQQVMPASGEIPLGGLEGSHSIRSTRRSYTNQISFAPCDFRAEVFLIDPIVYIPFPGLTIEKKLHQLYIDLHRMVQLSNGVSFLDEQKTIHYVKSQPGLFEQYKKSFEENPVYKDRDFDMGIKQCQQYLLALNLKQKISTLLPFPYNDEQRTNALWLSTQSSANPTWCLYSRLKTLLLHLNYSLDDGDGEPDIDAIKARFPQLKTIKDPAFAIRRNNIIAPTQDSQGLIQILSMDFRRVNTLDGQCVVGPDQKPLIRIWLEIEIPLQPTPPHQSATLKLKRFEIFSFHPGLEEAMTALFKHIQNGALSNRKYNPHSPVVTPTGSPRAAVANGSPAQRARSEVNAASAAAASGLTPNVRALGLGASQQQAPSMRDSSAKQRLPFGGRKSGKDKYAGLMAEDEDA